MSSPTIAIAASDLDSPSTATALPHVGTYRRRLPVSIVRLYENAIDWQHLPYVHSSSFKAIECLQSGDWGFRARLTNPAGANSVIELRLQQENHRWITRTLESPGLKTEIWTHAFVVAERITDIVIDFYAHGVMDEQKAQVGVAMTKLYARLYDEDVAMMCERQTQLDLQTQRYGAQASTDVFDLGALNALKLPTEFLWRGKPFVLILHRGELCAVAARCPHSLGPLTEVPIRDYLATCPWHGYQFDIRNGDCISGQPCRLPLAPTVVVDQGRVLLRSSK